MPAQFGRMEELLDVGGYPWCWSGIDLPAPDCASQP
jgi:hypothetical protein